MTAISFDPANLDAAVPPPPQPGPPLPPAIAPAAVPASEVARRSPITHVRYVALATEDLAATVAFYQGIWGLYEVGRDSDVVFLGAVGSPEPFVVRVRRADERRTDLIAFGAPDRAAVDGLAARLGSDGVRIAAEPGRLDRFLAGPSPSIHLPDALLFLLTGDGGLRPRVLGV